MDPYEIRGVTMSDLPEVAANLRAADIREIIAATGSLNIETSLAHTVNASTEALLVQSNNSPLLLFGYVKTAPTSLVIWAVGTPAIKKYSRDFLRESRKTLKQWFLENPEVQSMWNFTYAENTLHHRWLKWCGAELLPPVQNGHTGERFIPFVIKRSSYDV